jgi:hypothetical protein
METPMRLCGDAHSQVFEIDIAPGGKAALGIAKPGH